MEIRQLDQHGLGCRLQDFNISVFDNIMSLIIPPILPEMVGLHIAGRMKDFGFEANGGYLNVFCLIPPQNQFACDQ